MSALDTVIMATCFFHIVTCFCFFQWLLENWRMNRGR